MLKYWVAMSRSSTPWRPSAARTASIASAASARAPATVGRVTSTPTLSTAMSGVTVTLPEPVTEMPVCCGWFTVTVVSPSPQAASSAIAASSEAASPVRMFMMRPPLARYVSGSCPGVLCV